MFGKVSNTWSLMGDSWELLKQDKRIKGVFGVSWFYDPQLTEISPRLVYLRKLFTDNGGRVFYIGPNEQATKDALTRSQTRRDLYEQGKYVPTHYIIIWSRKDVLAWADKYSSEPDVESGNNAP